MEKENPLKFVVDANSNLIHKKTWFFLDERKAQASINIDVAV